MRDWIGTIFFVIAALLLVSGVVHKRRVLAARVAPAAGGIVPARPELGSIAALGMMMRPLILFFLAFAAVTTVMMYILLGGEKVLSYFDLAGVLALLVAYGTWLILRTTYRRSDLAMAKAAAVAAEATELAPSGTPPYVGIPANDRGPPDGGLPRVRRVR